MSAAETRRSSCAPASPGRTDGYERHRPEETLLYRVVREHWPAFRSKAEDEGGLPKFVVREFDDYLGCGQLERGLVHLACSRCGHSMVVAFSCKRRGFCPSCTGRRMADVAAHMVDDVFPEVPIRQWVCSFPWSLRTPLGYDRRLCAAVMSAFARALAHSTRWRAKKLLGLPSVQDALFGAVTFVQRSDSALRLNPHAHVIALDGVYMRAAAGALVFHALPAPSAQDVHDVAERTHARLVKVLAQHGRSLDAPDEGEPAPDGEQAVLASCYAASAADVQLLGERAGQRTTKLVRALRSAGSAEVAPPSNKAHAEVGGVDVHAEVALDGRDRKHLERLVRYVTRPPLATDRLEEHDGGRLRYRLKKAWKDGTHAVVLEPLELIARLCAIIPPPRFHLVRYHGVLAANARERAEVVPAKAKPPPPGGEQLPLPLSLPPGAAGGSASTMAPPEKPRTAEPSRHPWSWLLTRVFAADVTTCERAGCGGRMRIVEIATERSDISRVLFELGLGARGPPRPRPARPVPAGQLSLDFAR